MNNLGAAAIIVGIIAVAIYLCEKVKAVVPTTPIPAVTAAQQVVTSPPAPYEVTQVGNTTYVKMTSSGGVEKIVLPNNAPVGTTGPR